MMKTEILKLLRESGGYISGQELCSKFGVSRTAVWKVMNQLKEEGYGIEAVKNKGYHLEITPDVLSYSELKAVSEISGRAGISIITRKPGPRISMLNVLAKRVRPMGR